MKYLLISSLLVGCAFAQEEKPQKLSKKETSTGEIIDVDKDNKEMNAAMQKARDTFVTGFIKLTTDKTIEDEISGSMLKVYFSTKANPDEGEHMWVTGATFDGKNTITGTLASQAHGKGLPKLHSKVSFTLDKLSDWLVIRNNYAEGAYTVRLLRSKMNAKDRKLHDSYYPFKFDKVVEKK